MVFIFVNLFDLLKCPVVDELNTGTKDLTTKLLSEGYRYHKLRKAFSKFYQ